MKLELILSREDPHAARRHEIRRVPDKRLADVRAFLEWLARFNHLKMRPLRVLEAALELTRASLELRLRPKTRTLAVLGSIQVQNKPDKPVSALKLRDAQRVGGTVTRVARLLPWRPTCLRQALAVQRMLRRRNIPCLLRLGVTHPSIHTAHAWVTVADHPVVGRSGLERWTPLASFD